MHILAFSLTTILDRYYDLSKVLSKKSHKFKNSKIQKFKSLNLSIFSRRIFDWIFVRNGTVRFHGGCPIQMKWNFSYANYKGEPNRQKVSYGNYKGNISFQFDRTASMEPTKSMHQSQTHIKICCKKKTFCFFNFLCFCIFGIFYLGFH